MPTLSELEPNKKGPSRKALFFGGAATTLTAVSAVLSACDKNEPNPDTTLTPQSEPTMARIHIPDIDLSLEEQVSAIYRGSESLPHDSTEQTVADATLATILKVKSLQDKDLHTYNQSFFNYDEGNNTIVLYEHEFDLNKTNDLIIGSSLADYYFQLSNEDQLVRMGAQPHEIRATRNVDDLVWLRDNFEFKVTDATPIQNSLALNKVAQILKGMKEAGLELPNTIKFSSGRKIDKEDLTTPTLQISSEEGRFDAQGQVAKYVIFRKPEIFEQYSELVSEELAKHGNNIRYPEFTTTRYISAEDTDQQSFAREYSDYFLNGVDIRKRITYARAIGYHAEAEILEAKYNFYRSIANGVEFSQQGKVQEARVYSPGEVALVEDYEQPSGPYGIYLRQSPTLEIDDINGPIVSSNTYVQVVSEGTLVVKAKEAVLMYKVQAGTIVSGRVFVPYTDADGQPRIQGYISEEWLKESVELP